MLGRKEIEVMHKSTFIRLTGIRLGAIAITKSIGLVGRVVLTRIIGAEGIGLFQIAYAYFGFALMLITSGFPTALAIYTARRQDYGWIWFKRLTVWLLFMGVIAFIITLGFADKISHILGNSNSYYFIRALAPALVVVPLLALFRGYLQGLEQYEAIAYSEVFEQFVRVIVMLAICVILLPQGVMIAGGLSLIGTSVGGIVAFAILLIFYNRSVGRSTYHDNLSLPSTKGDFAWFVRSSFIICLTRLLIPFSDMLDALIIPGRLQSIGYSSQEATAMFGMLTGIALLIAYFPTMVTAAISHTMTMKLASAWKNKQDHIYRNYSLKVLRHAWSWGSVSTLFLMVYAEELVLIIFGSTEASNLIRGLAVIPLIVGLREITTSILWAQEQKNVTFIATAIGIVFAIGCHYFLIPVPYLQLYGSILGIVLMELIVLAANIFALRFLISPLRLRRSVIETHLLLISCIPLGYLIRFCSQKWLPNIIGEISGMGLFGAFLLLVHIWINKRL